MNLKIKLHHINQYLNIMNSNNNNLFILLRHNLVEDNSIYRHLHILIKGYHQCKNYIRFLINNNNNSNIINSSNNMIPNPIYILN